MEQDRPEPPRSAGQIGPEAEEDGRLVREVLAGRREAFDRLVQRHERRALAVAYRLLSHAQDSQEAVQEAMLKAYQALATLDNPLLFGPWLLRIVTNMALNLRRARGRRATVSLDNDPDNAEQASESLAAVLASREDRPEREAMTEELAERIRQALDDLPERQRAALVLFSVENISQKEVAEIIGCSVEAVKWHVFDARRKLKERLVDVLDDG